MLVRRVSRERVSENSLNQMPNEREQQLAEWFVNWSGLRASPLQQVAGDASFRRYFRVSTGERSIILCDSPPETEKNAEFERITRALAASGVRVPAIIQIEHERGFFALEDLGDDVLLPHLREDNVDLYYRQALGMLEQIALADPEPFHLPSYDRALLSTELRLFPEWFCEGLLQVPSTAASRELFADLETVLCRSALAQPTVVVHRDFHSRNLMQLGDGSLAAIDYQDAVLGPVTYDLVSLLRDCYVRWSPDRVKTWMLGYHQALKQRGVPVPPRAEFQRDFDWMGLQRHIKVLGIFARLHLRDGKAGYLSDLPLVIRYVLEVLREYPNEPALANFAQWFDDEVLPRAQRQKWFDKDV